MLWTQPEPAFGFLVHDISRLLRKRFDRRARALGLTKAQWIVLVHLARHEGINQTGLADILEVEPITLARHLDRLGETGWVERRADPADRRAWRLHLTGKARPILEQMATLVEETMEEALDGLEDGDRARLRTMLLHIRGNLSEREQPAYEEPDGKGEGAPPGVASGGRSRDGDGGGSGRSGAESPAGEDGGPGGHSRPAPARSRGGRRGAKSAGST